MSEEAVFVDPEIAALRKALHVAWVLIGRLDYTLEELTKPYLSNKGKRELIEKMRAEVLHATGSHS